MKETDRSVISYRKRSNREVSLTTFSTVGFRKYVFNIFLSVYKFPQGVRRVKSENGFEKVGGKGDMKAFEWVGISVWSL